MKCLEIIAHGEKIKTFNEELMDSYLKCLIGSTKNVSNDFLEFKLIFKKLAEINQRFLMDKIIGLVTSLNETEELRKILQYSSMIKLKVKYHRENSKFMF